MTFQECVVCNQRFFDLDVVDGSCKQCRRYNSLGQLNPFFVENDMQRGEIPAELAVLTFVEQVAIARVHPMVSVYKLKFGQLGYSGQVISFPQNVNSLATSLPLSIDQISQFVILRRGGDFNHRDFYVNRENVRRALIWLQHNNRYYADIQINNQNLANFPAGGNVYQDLVNSQNAENDSLMHSHNLDLQSDELQSQQDFAAPIMRSGVADLAMIDQRLLIQDILGFQLSKTHSPAAILPWPEIGPKLFNLYLI